jgi:hypothetical protein
MKLVLLLHFAAAHLFLRAERENFLAVHTHGHAHGVARGQRGMPTPEWCATFGTPCDCTVEGCGWSTTESLCVLGGTTDCLECPNPMLCGDETCMMDVMKDGQVVQAMKLGEECLADGNDMAVCLCDPEIGNVLADRLFEKGCCDANEMFQQMCHGRKCADIPEASDDGVEVKDGAYCGNIVEPCECGIEPGCGWDSETSVCTPGAATTCRDCAHSMLCSKTDNRCSTQLFKNPDFLETINRAKVCMEAQRETVDECIAHEGADLKKFIDGVEINGEEKDCCAENKYFKMICEPPATPPKHPAGEGPCGEHKHCQEGLVCADHPDGTAGDKTGICLKPGDGQGPCEADTDCREGTTCGEDNKCHLPLSKEGESCEEKKCEEGLVCGDDKKCVKGALSKEGEACEKTEDCEEGLSCGEGGKCVKGLSKLDEACEKAEDCEKGLTCGEGGKCVKGLSQLDEPCEKSEDCDKGLTCGEGGKCVKGLSIEGEPCEKSEDCEEGLECGEDEVCHAPLAKLDEDCETTENCEEGLECIDGACAGVSSTSTTSFFDIMKAIEKIARQSKLVTTTPAPEEPEEPEEPAAGPAPTAGDAIADINAAAKANHDSTSDSIDAANKRAEKEIGFRKIPDEK